MKQKLLLSFLFLVVCAALSFAQTTYYLGVGTPSDPQATSCASCHATGGIGQPVYDEWINTGHAIAQDSVSSNHYGYACLGCHNTGWDVTQTNYGADEYVMLDTSAHPNYVITDQVNFNRVKNVQCESCHGPLGTSQRTLDNSHWGFWTNTSNVPNFTAEMCGSCHDGAHHPYYTEWAMSGHASGPPAFLRNRQTRGECFYCHYTEDFIAFLEDPDYNGTTFQATKSDANLDVITCVTCHDPHAKTNPGQLRLPITGQQVICDVCHTVHVDSVDVNDTPHHSTSEALSGADIFGYQYEGETYQNSAHTYAALNRCVDCHVYPSPYNPQTGANTGHTFEPRVEACARCHADYYAVVDTSNAETRFDYRGVQSETDSLIEALQAELDMATSADSATIEFKRAKYNLLSAEAEGSVGIHNTRLVQKLLRDAIARFSPTGVVETEDGVPVSYNLSQNYPNPFNPSTQIKFALPEAANVKLTIYDAIGKKVAEIINDHYAAGNYKVNWNAGKYASGIYFYKLETDNFQMVKKMVLVK